MPDDTLMRLDKLSLANGSGPRLCEALSMDIHAGECIGILGPNGSGKTTLLHTLAGLQKPAAGQALLQGKNLAHWSHVELARIIGLLFQNSQDDMPATVLETVMLGRLPHQRAWRGTSASDWQACNTAMQQMQLCDLATRELTQLSGGERQRVAMACLLAQAPALYLLDEPGNHLDISFQITSMQLFETLVTQQRCSVLMATHDINLAARFCDRIVLMGTRYKGQHQAIVGSTREVLTESNLSEAFAFDVRRISNEEHSWFYPAAPRI